MRHLLLATALTTGVLAAGAAWAQEEGDEPTEIIVRGAFIPDEKRDTSEISSVLDAEDFALSGDSDVAAALTRVTGLSLSEGKFVVVRGLNERYSAVTLNGTTLPSPEPLRRVAPLDLFPTSVIQSTLVQKTFSPEFSGEFGGGGVDLRSRLLPDERFFELSLSTGANSETTLEKGLTHHGSDTDWLGYDDGLRALPDVIRNAIESTGTPVSEADRLGYAIENNDSLLVQTMTMPGDFGIGAKAGDRFELGSNVTLGVTLSGGYDNDWRSVQALRQATTPTAAIGNPRKHVQSSTNSIGANALVAFGLDLYDNHELRWTNLYVRDTSKKSRIEQFLETDPAQTDELDRYWQTDWVERFVAMSQFSGTHYLDFGGNQLQADWRLAGTRADRYAPNQHFTVFQPIAGAQDTSAGFRWINRLGGGFQRNTVRYFDMQEDGLDGGVDFQLPVTFGSMDVTFKFGGAYNNRERESENFSFQYRGSLSDQFDIVDPRTVLENGDLEGCTGSPLCWTFLQEDSDQSRPIISEGEIDVTAGYVGVDAQINPYIRAAAGARFEESTINISSRALTSGGFVDTQFPELAEEYWMPAASITWNFFNDMQVRASYSETVVRPQFHELQPTLFFDIDTDEFYQGNPVLQTTELKNYDIRYEYYFGRDQFFTLGAFYKELENPVADILRQNNSTQFVRYANIPSAELMGAEVEFEKRFDLPSLGLSQSFFATKELIAKANYTWSDSEISVPAGETCPQFLAGVGNITIDGVTFPGQLFDCQALLEDGQRLPKQSDHIANLQLGWEDYETGSTLVLSYNWVSERVRGYSLSLGGIYRTVYEELPATLDLNFSRPFTVHDKDFEFGFKVRNILDERYEAIEEASDGSIGTALFDSYRDGVSGSISLTYKY